MRELNAERASNCLRTLDEAEIQKVSGGGANIVKAVDMGYFGTMLWFDNGCASYIFSAQGESSGSSIMTVYTQC
jgi:hypothetical protein